MLGKPTLDADLYQDNQFGAAIVGWGGFILGQSVGGQIAGYFCLGIGAAAGAALEAWAKAAAKEIGSILDKVAQWVLGSGHTWRSY
jgi:hypothetical protein